MHATRSWAFEQYLRRQPLARRLKLIAAEKEYSKAHGSHLTALEQVFWESMQGYADTNEGAAVCKIGAPEEHNSSWNWKPYRDKLLGDNFQTFCGVPPSAAELYRSTMHQPG